jgi:hypothetical protein
VEINGACIGPSSNEISILSNSLFCFLTLKFLEEDNAHSADFPLESLDSHPFILKIDTDDKEKINKV